jgi:putative ABC transport system permease protein
MVDTFSRDVRRAARSLFRSPGFSVSAVGMLGVAVGAAVAIYTVLNTTMLTPPPYPEPNRIVVFTTPTGSELATGSEFAFLRDRSRAFEIVAGQRATPGWNLVTGNHAEFVEGLEVTDGYFEVHRVALLMGRGISRVEAQVNGPRAVVLSEPIWRRLFDGRNVLGEFIEVGGRPHEIVGVAPAHFRSIPPAEVWTSMQVSRRANAGTVRILGRIASGFSHDDAVSELNALRPELRAVVPGQEDRIALVTWRPHQQWFAARSGDLMVSLIGGVGALLLIACINVAGLQVARAVRRSREFAARAALGASTAQLFWQAFTESVLLALGASVVGLVVAAIGTPALLSLLPEDLVTDLLAGAPITIDARVAAAALLLAALTAVMSGAVPALASARVDLRAATNESFRLTANRRAVWLRRLFTAAQVSVAFTLLIGAGLLIRTFGALRTAELGFAPAGVLVGEMAFQGETPAQEADRTLFINQALDRILQIPGVESAAVASAIPVDRPLNVGVQALGAARLSEPSNVDWAYTTPGYFDLFGIQLRVGRMFDGRDTIGALPVAVVNTSFARAFFGRDDVVGERIQVRSFGDAARLIVGVVGDVRARSGSSFGTGAIALAAPPPPFVYVPLSQVSGAAFRSVHQFTPLRWLVRTSEDAGGVAEAVRTTVRAVDPRRPFKHFAEMQEIISRDVGIHRFLATLLGVFAAIALTLAAFGLYALISTLVTQRRQEIGIRMSLGATGRRVVGAFFLEAFRLTLVGVAIGLTGAPFLTAGLAAFLVGVTPLDRVTYVLVPALLLVAAAAAILIPAARAARINPAITLRSL